MLYGVHTDSPLLQEAEECQNKMLDCNYSKADIDRMVLSLDMVRKFENGLFGGGLGKLRHCKPAHIKLKPSAMPYKGRYYNLPKAYEDVAIKLIQRIVDI